MSSRDTILNRLRQGRTAAAVATVASPLPAGLLDADPVERFIERARALDSSVERLASLAGLPAAVAAYLDSHQLPRRLVCWPQWAGLDWAAAGVEVEARPARGDDLVGLTGCFAALAETGTLMLLSGPATAAVTSLLPETHLAVVPASRIVTTLEQAFALLRSERGEPPRAVNLVSGPSRTGDIEQTITLGAHGPYRVRIWVVEDESEDTASEHSASEHSASEYTASEYTTR
ncbi:LutC/YkgG family protein [Chitinimonas lacunae]|uniref:Lactate utilization protein C n=1 Tax=Chitinimonas lacunae TaxID=1963018 RepID=A0ABV8MW00_9NEIS